MTIVPVAFDIFWVCERAYCHDCISAIEAKDLLFYHKAFTYVSHLVQNLNLVAYTAINVCNEYNAITIAVIINWDPKFAVIISVIYKFTMVLWQYQNQSMCMIESCAWNHWLVGASCKFNYFYWSPFKTDSSLFTRTYSEVPNLIDSSLHLHSSLTRSPSILSHFFVFFLQETSDDALWEPSSAVIGRVMSVFCTGFSVFVLCINMCTA